MEVSIFAALMGGVLSFLSPCVLPMIPMYLAYMAGTSLNSENAQKKVLIGSILFVVGFTITFILVGVVLNEFVSNFVGSERFMQFAGVLLILFGVHTTGIYKFKFLMYEMKMNSNDSKLSHFGAFILGVTFAFGWSPCIGPILSAILAMASSSESYSSAIILMGFYSLGLGIPFILSGLLIDRFLNFSKKFRSNFELVEKISGVLIILIGLSMIFLGSETISIFFSELFPEASGLLEIEDKLIEDE
jgi:cytochrome c-type biogenesis protein